MKKKLVFFVTEDWYFVSHRLNLAVAALGAGYDVTVITRCQAHATQLVDAGIRVVNFNTHRRSVNPIIILLEIIRLTRLYLKLQPTIVHHVALRSIIIGGLAARLAKIQRVVAAVTGMGFVYTDNTRRPFLRRAVSWLLSKILHGELIIVQNSDDQNLLTSLGLKNKFIRLIPGAGVDTKKFACPLRKDQNKRPIVMFASRFLWDKGIGEFISAAVALKATNALFVLVGEPDLANPASVTQDQVTKWLNSGAVVDWGHCENMPEVLTRADIICLPSYREGLPKVLLEAMACGRPCITTDVPGCREVVKHNDNGLLVEAKNPTQLADAISKLLSDAPLREKMGIRGRARVITEFDEKLIIGATISIYNEMVSF